MTTTCVRRVVLTLLCSTMSASQLGAQSHPRYRTYQMGDDVLTISRQLGVPAPAGILMPPGPGTVVELRWRSMAAANPWIFKAHHPERSEGSTEVAHASPAGMDPSPGSGSRGAGGGSRADLSVTFGSARLGPWTLLVR